MYTMRHIFSHTSLSLSLSSHLFFFFFFFNDTATTEIYTLSLHDALPISIHRFRPRRVTLRPEPQRLFRVPLPTEETRSEEHTSELQSRLHLVCRLLLEKKKQQDSEFVCIDSAIC